MYVEQTLDEFKQSIRTKLRLDDDVDLRLAQARDGRHVDLEDGKGSSACSTYLLFIVIGRLAHGCEYPQTRTSRRSLLQAR